MSIRFLADEDLDADIIAGLRSREPAIDILDIKSTGLRGTKDPDLLEIAAQQGVIAVVAEHEEHVRRNNHLAVEDVVLEHVAAPRRGISFRRQREVVAIDRKSVV